LLLWAALHALFLAGDLFTLYLLLELVAVAGVALVVLGRDGRALLAGTRYFFAEFAASTTFLLGVALIWRDAGTVVMADLPSAASATPAAGAGLALMTVGLLLKIPLVPVHFWLPDAHSRSPSAVSPVLSALVVKTAFAVLIRLWFLALPDVTTTAAAQLLGGLAAAAIVWGSLNALRVGPAEAAGRLLHRRPARVHGAAGPAGAGRIIRRLGRWGGPGRLPRTGEGGRRSSPPR
jgi:multicomponent Na+:H+ antiporter subunit D